MANDRKQSNVGLALFVGMAVGAVAGLFMAPKSGKENREEARKKLEELKKSWENGSMQKKVEETFGEISDESMKMYQTAQEELIKRMDTVKDLTDTAAYEEMVTSVVKWVQEKMGMSGEEADVKGRKLAKALKEEVKKRPAKRKPAITTKK